MRTCPFAPKGKAPGGMFQEAWGSNHLLSLTTANTGSLGPGMGRTLCLPLAAGMVAANVCKR